ncbi:Lrp/AsnC family transcriptional regulator [Methylobacterium oryzae CBMB20]
MDAVDRKILDILQQDATLPVAELAERVGVQRGAVLAPGEEAGGLGRDPAPGRRWSTAARSTCPPRSSWPSKAPRHAADWSGRVPTGASPASRRSSRRGA